MVHRLLNIGLWLLCRRRRLKVYGNSMSPLYKEGDQVFVKRTGKIGPGDIAVAKHPYQKTLIIKQVTNVENGRYTLRGLAESTDSRCFGTISREQIIGKVTAKL